MEHLKKAALAVVTASASLAGTANAAIDLTAVEQGFADLNAAIIVVGGLIITAAITAVVYKWIKGMIFS